MRFIGLFVVLGGFFYILPKFVFAEVEPAATTKKIEQQINIINKSIPISSGTPSPTDNSQGLIDFDPADYSGTIKVYFEAVMRLNSGDDIEAGLYDDGSSTAEPGSLVATTSSVFKRVFCHEIIDPGCTIRAELTSVPVAGKYTVRGACTGPTCSGDIRAARLIIVQTESDNITKTKTNIEVGYSHSTNSTGYTSGSKLKIIEFNNADYQSGTKNLELQATIKCGNAPGIVSTESGIDVGLFRVDDNGNTTTEQATLSVSGGDVHCSNAWLTRSTPIGAIPDGLYAIVIKRENVGTDTVFLENAKLVVKQQDIATIRVHQEQVNMRFNTTFDEMQYFNEFNLSNFIGFEVTESLFMTTASFQDVNVDKIDLYSETEAACAESDIVDDADLLKFYKSFESLSITPTDYDTCVDALEINDSRLAIKFRSVPPGSPSDFRNGTVTETSIQWLWNDNSSDETGFQVTNSSATTLANADCRNLPPNTTSCVENGLSPDTLYSRRVYAQRGFSISNFSDVDSAVTLPDGPKLPSSVTPGHNSTDNFYLDLTWTAPAPGDFTTFSINRFQDSDCTSGFSTPLDDTAASSIRDSNLDSGTTYCYRIRSQNQVGVENTTEEVFITGTTISDTTPPESFSPQAPAAGKLLANSAGITFTWTASSDDFELARYEIYVSDNKVGETDGNTTSLTIDLSLNDGTHNWYVLAVDTSGNTTRTGSETFVLDTAAPDEPTNLRAYENSSKRGILIAGIANSSANPYFEWDPAFDRTSGVDGYFVYFGRSSTANPISGGQFITSANFSSTIASIGGNDETVAGKDQVFEGLRGLLIGEAQAAEPGDYFLRIAAKDRAGHVSGIWNAFNYKYDPASGGAVANTLGSIGEALEKSTAARAAAIAVPAAVIALELPNLYAFFIYLFQLITSFFTKLRKKKFWGVVYDSVTKQPVPLALVRLTGPTTQLAVTDREGRYGFVIDAGTYELSIKKQGYSFPTISIVGEKDGEYSPLYTGGTFGVEAGKEELVDLHVPLDPVSMTGKKKFFSMDRIREGLFFPLLILNLAGVVVNGILWWRTRNFLYAGFGILYTMLLVLNTKRLVERYLKDKPQFGVVRDFLSNLPIEGATVRLVDKATGNQISARRTSENGKFAFFVRRAGNYILKTEKEGYQFDEAEVSYTPGDSPYITGEITGKLVTVSRPTTPPTTGPLPSPSGIA